MGRTDREKVRSEKRGVKEGELEGRERIWRQGIRKGIR